MKTKTIHNGKLTRDAWIDEMASTKKSELIVDNGLRTLTTLCMIGLIFILLSLPLTHVEIIFPYLFFGTLLVLVVGYRVRLEYQAWGKTKFKVK